MPAILLKLLSHTLVRQLILLGLREASKRTDNTIDDEIVRIVEHGFANRVNPIRRVAEVPK